jgi:hypothetical protein
MGVPQEANDRFDICSDGLNVAKSSLDGDIDLTAKKINRTSAIHHGGELIFC